MVPLLAPAKGGWAGGDPENRAARP